MYGVASQPTSPKKSANVLLAENLLTEARRLQINISQAAEAGLQENQEAIESSNEYVEKHGLPLDKYRMF